MGAMYGGIGGRGTGGVFHRLRGARARQVSHEIAPRVSGAKLVGVARTVRSQRATDTGVQGAHLNPLGLFLRTSIPFI
jgi:hypothetical protein